jgi:hypothetical protein
MGRLPTLLASSVIRGSRLGESHGGLYMIDLDRRAAELKLDWNDTGIDISGRGGDRGLRGIAFHDEHILVAANAELLFLDQDFRVTESFTNPYLEHCHEICVANGRVLLTATGFDSLLIFDLRTKRFIDGWHLSAAGNSLSLRRYDPTASDSGIWFSGLNTPGLLHADGRTLNLVAQLPPGTHNARLFEDGVLYNDTESDRVCHSRNGSAAAIAVPAFRPDEIINIDKFASAIARPGFARGLCVLPEGLVAAGSSPSTISVYDMRAGKRVLQQNLSMDVRNAVHGLAVWPYG